MFNKRWFMLMIGIIFLTSLMVMSQTVNISGVVKNDEGQLLQGVRVAIRNSNLVTLTDVNGRFQIGGVVGINKKSSCYSGLNSPIIFKNKLIVALYKPIQDVSLKVYNSKGQLVDQSFMSKMERGNYQLPIFNKSKQITKGLYNVSVQIDNDKFSFSMMYFGNQNIHSKSFINNTIKVNKNTAAVGIDSIPILEITKDGYVPERRDLRGVDVVVDTIELQSNVTIPIPQKITSMTVPEKISRTFVLNNKVSNNLDSQFIQIANEFNIKVCTTSTELDATIINIKYGTNSEAIKNINEKGEQGYKLTISLLQNRIVIDITAGDETGAFYGLQTLKSLMYIKNNNLYIRPMTIEDWPAFKRRGVIIGYVDNEVLKDRVDFMSGFKLNQFVHAGLRNEWDENIQRRVIDLKNNCDNNYTEFTSLMGYHSRLYDMGDTITNYFRKRFDAGIRSFTINFDDQEITNIQNGTIFAEQHSAVVNNVYKYLKQLDSTTKFIFCPVPYGGKPSTGLSSVTSVDIGVKYLNIIADSTPSDISIFWTGDIYVFSATITESGANEISSITRGRLPFVWDNDAILFSKNRNPLSGRDKGLYKSTSGYIVNLNEIETVWDNSKNAEFVLLSSAMYCWNPEKYDTAVARKEIEKIIGRKYSVTASSSYDRDGWNVYNIVDGVKKSTITSLGWSSVDQPNENHSEWVIVNRKNVKPLNTVVLYPRTDGYSLGDGFPIDFTIEVSKDSISWTKVVDTTNFAKPNSASTFTFNSIECKYVMVRGSRLRPIGNAYHMQFSEIELFNNGEKF